ncbi:MAG TPA: MBL fold metallo-hydrolase [Paucimonas sp.]|nr:MBL fold metallo-hydrolase [Paucimonas sp.]
MSTRHSGAQALSNKIRRTGLLAVAAAIGASAFAAEPVWDANKVELNSLELAKGVHALVPANADHAHRGVPLATTSGIIAGSKGVLVIDTMINERLANQVLNHVKSKTKLPIRYALNTSYHGDHSFGNQYFPRSTAIIQHVNAKNYIDANFDKDVQFMRGAFGEGRGIEKAKARTGDILVPKDGKLELDLGGKIVQIIDFGFAQTGGDLFVWDPQSKVLFAGNPVIAQQPALPWLLDGHLQETLATMQRVHDFLPADARIVPGHGPVVGRDALQWHIGYLAELKMQVAQALEKGMTLEQTVAAVELPQYKGYAIYDWVHKQINVPAAYKELRKP